MQHTFAPLAVSLRQLEDCPAAQAPADRAVVFAP
jgi:hypothetical protein